MTTAILSEEKISHAVLELAHILEQHADHPSMQATSLGLPFTTRQLLDELKKMDARRFRELAALDAVLG